MTKKYYQTLETSKDATQEEIKKAYRKLAAKWHPDKWNTKKLEEREEANRKMKEINEAYEVLGDEEKRKRYNNGETNFTNDNYDWKEEIRKQKEELNKQASDIQGKLKVNKAHIILLARWSVISRINSLMSIVEFFEYKHLKNIDSSLWFPYNSWQEKVMKMEITIPDGKISSERLDSFEKIMSKEIEKTMELYRNGVNNPEVDRARKIAVEDIEKVITEKGLKEQDLGKYSNYWEHINSLNKVWKIQSLRENIIDSIWEIAKKRKKTNTGFAPMNSSDRSTENIGLPQNKDTKKSNDVLNKLKKISEQSPSTENNEVWDKEKEALLKQIQKLKSQNNQEQLVREINSLKRLVQQLEREIQELKSEIQELKTEKDNSPEFQSYLSKKENKLRSNQSKLEQLKGIINDDSRELKTKSDNNFSTSLVIGGGIVLLVAGLVAILIIRSKKKKKL